MTLQAKRFNITDGENNLIQKSFLKANNLSILNLPFIEDLTGDFLDFIGSALQDSGLNDLVNIDLASIVDNSVRAGKDLVNSITDVTGLDKSAITDLLSNTFNNSSTSSLLSQLPDGLLNNLLGSNVPGNMLNSSLDSKSLLTQAINSLTTDSPLSLVANKQQTLQGITSISKLAADLGVTGAFEALSTGVDNNTLSKASVTLLQTLSKASNTNAVIDVLSSSANLSIKSQSPGIVQTLIKNLNVPSDLKQIDYSSFVTNFNASVAALDINWNKSSLDDILSLANIPKNDSYITMLGSTVMNNFYDQNNLSVAPNDDLTFLKVALSAI